MGKAILIPQYNDSKIFRKLGIKIINKYYWKLVKEELITNIKKLIIFNY